MSDENTASELSEDMEVIGPGQMLAEARIKMGLSQEQVAEKLNFRPLLVRDIEAEIYDKSLPTTFNRGYLRNYAKLVNISVEQVLASYEMLGVAEAQGAELQSFSKNTEKQAENNLVMWISYLVIALLIGSTVMWWLQDVKKDGTSVVLPENKSDKNVVIKPQRTPVSAIKPVTAKSNGKSIDNQAAQAGTERTNSLEPVNNSESAEQVSAAQVSHLEPATTPEQENSLERADNPAQINNTASVDSAQNNEKLLASQQSLPAVSTAVFTFSGDCYVNIFDATGERIAYGLKKSGYVMTISGVAPLNITIGRPDLVAISFDGQAVDMSMYSGGNIAKFNLPMNSSGA